jgi:hypothetical protein
MTNRNKAEDDVEEKTPSDYLRDEFDEVSDDEFPEELFEPDERFPPAFHLDNLESQLDFNLGQVDGFFELDWSAKCDLAKIAVEEDLDLENVETILELSSDVEVGDSDV